jgi:hypothetical protein
MRENIVNIENLRPSVRRVRADKKFFVEKGIYEMRKAFRKRFHGFGLADRHDHVSPEYLDKAFGFLDAISDDNGIKASAPHGVGETHCLPEALNIARANGPANTQRSVADIDADGIQLGFRYPTFTGTSVIVSFPKISMTLTATV